MRGLADNGKQRQQEEEALVTAMATVMATVTALAMVTAMVMVM
jgi:hypothetical protein